MWLKFLSRLFPQEKFLKPPYIGLSFSDSEIKAVSFGDKRSDFPLKSAVVPIEKGAIVSGNVIDAEEVGKKLSTLKKLFDSPFVFFTVPDELCFVFSALVPVSVGGNAREGVAFVIEENVPFALNDIIFDFVPTKIIQSDSEYKASVVVAACVKKETEKFMEILKKSQFEPIGCIHESQAVAKALIPNGFIGTSCIVHARKNRIGIYLVEDGLVVFSTVRPAVGEDYEKQFLDEYEKFMEYYSKYVADQNKSIKSALICGQFDYAKKITKTMTESGNCVGNASLANVWVNAFEIDKYAPKVSYEDSLDFAGAVGAALSDIN